MNTLSYLKVYAFKPVNLMLKYFKENYMFDASNVICRPSKQLKEGGGTYSKSGSG